MATRRELLLALALRVNPPRSRGKAVFWSPAYRQVFESGVAAYRAMAYKIVSARKEREKCRREFRYDGRGSERRLV
jgi:hypothetical protein